MTLRIIAACTFCTVSLLRAETSPIFPEPQHWKLQPGSFAVTGDTRILVPSQPSEADLQFARIICGELADRYGVGVRIDRVATTSKAKHYILLGSIANPLVKASRAGSGAIASDSHSEGYRLTVSGDSVVVAGDDEAGAFYGVQSLRQLIHKEAKEVSIFGAEVRDWPAMPFRGIKLFLPGHDNLPFFRRFVLDFMAQYKFNKLVVEVNAGMRFDRHPELNAGWIDFGKDLAYTRRDRPLGPRGEFQDSSHQDTADGSVLEKEEVAGIVRLANENHIEVIPEIPALTHSYYLLTRHRELAEIQQAEWPDTYCPLIPGSYDLLFDVLDEYIEVMHPKSIHMGHDEWRTPIDLCPRCKDKDHTELFIAEVNKIHDYLTRHGIRMAIWGDHLIEPLRGKKVSEARYSGRSYLVPGGLSPEQVEKSIPKDILMFNWFWGDHSGGGEESKKRTDDRFGEVNDIRLEQWGFEQVWGNFRPGMDDYARRTHRRGVLGGAPSAWEATSELNFGKDVLYDFLGTAPMLWSSVWQDQAQLHGAVQNLMPRVRRDLSGRNLPGADGDPITQLALPETVDSAQWGKVLVVKTQTASAAAPVIPIGRDVSSIIFEHAVVSPSGHEKVSKAIYNGEDTSDLLGWYEVVYQDGMTESVPIRYGWNVLEWNWPASTKSAEYCYLGDIDRSAKAAFFRYEWVNPRFGVPIKEVRVHGTTEAATLQHRRIDENTILLRNIQVVEKRSLAGRAGAVPGPAAPK